MGERFTPDAERLEADLARLATFRDPALPGWTRRPFTPPYAAAREWLAEQMAAAGLTVSIDAAGNLIGRRAGTVDLPPLLLGSHVDTVLGGGRFDGMLGVVGAVEVARWLAASGTALRHPLEVVDFLAEEPTDFGISTVGSRGLVGNLSASMLALADPAGRALAEAIASVGGQPAALAAPLRTPGSVAAFVELHIEQGLLLERAGLPIGVVTGIVGIHRFRVRLTGRPDHAGTTPMDLRRDAFPGAAELVLGLEAMCQGDAGVGTAGRAHIKPNATNVIPGAVELWLEMRSMDAAWLAERGARLAALAEEVARRRDLGLAFETISAEPPAHADERIMAAVEAVLAELGLPSRRLPSGAGHDGVQLAHIAPMGMIFVPSQGGRSHCPEEYTPPDQLARGVQVLGETLLRLDRALGGER